MTLVRYTYPTARSFAPFARSPWAGLESEIDRLFQSSLGDFAGTAATRRVPVDLYEDKDNTYVRAELPGVNHAGLEVRADSETFTVTGRRTWKKPEGWTPLYRESDEAAYQLVLTHDNVLDLDKVQAELRDGVLRVALVKTEAIKPRRITVS